MGKRKHKNQKKDNTIYYVAGALAVIVLVIVFAVGRPTGQVVAGDGEFDEFATCLTDNGAIFYGTEWCGFCQQQKAMFGASMENVNFIDCDQNRDTCMSEGITGYPTWKINGQLYPGLQQLTRLSELTGCTLFA